VLVGVGVGVIQLQVVFPYVTLDIVAPIPYTVPTSTQSFITCGPIPYKPLTGVPQQFIYPTVPALTTSKLTVVTQLGGSVVAVGVGVGVNTGVAVGVGVGVNTGVAVGVGVTVGVEVTVGVGVGVGMFEIDIGVVSKSQPAPVDLILICVVPSGANVPDDKLNNVTPVINGVPEHVDPVHEYKSKGPGDPTIEFNVIVTGTDIFYIFISFFL
jgi:hypothetical protein